MHTEPKKTEMKIAFVILNYNTYEETKECILSIEDKLDTKDYRIVVVDNCSCDDSAGKIAEFIRDKSQIELIKNSENLGFARGNNVGIAYANKKYAPDYVVACNSDTEIISDNMTEVLDNEYKNSNFAVFAPLVLNKSGVYNAGPGEPSTIEDTLKQLKDSKRMLKLLKLGLYDLYSFLNYIKELMCYVVQNLFRGREQRKKAIILCPKYQTQKVLHGCFLIFSKKAFRYIEGFDNRTFLYHEEDLLYQNVKKHGLVTVFDPEVAVFHREGCASRTLRKEKKGKLLFKYQCYVESLSVRYEDLKNKNTK